MWSVVFLSPLCSQLLVRRAQLYAAFVIYLLELVLSFSLSNLFCFSLFSNLCFELLFVSWEISNKQTQTLEKKQFFSKHTRTTVQISCITSSRLFFLSLFSFHSLSCLSFFHTTRSFPPLLFHNQTIHSAQFALFIFPPQSFS